MAALTHFDDKGDAHMVNVSDKAETERTATAGASVLMRAETLQLIVAGGNKKGDVLGVARLAGIMAAKRTPDLIPLCNPLALTHVSVSLTCDAQRNSVDIRATCKQSSWAGQDDACTHHSQRNESVAATNFWSGSGKAG